MGAIQIRTAIPGPASKELWRRREQAVPGGIFTATPIFIAHADGALVEDVDGNRLIDFAGGIGSLNVGHRAPRVLAAVRAQIDRYLHACFSVTPYEPYIALAEKMNAAAPGAFAKKTMFVNSGAEAVENAVKIARCYTGRPAVVCFEDAFHGRTLLTMSLTSKTHPYKAGFGPFAGEIYRLPYAYCYRCAYSLRYPGCGVHCAHEVRTLFARGVAAESVAAVIAEPVLGEGGFVPGPPEFFQVIQQICREHGILFIADEVQTGFGRTGAMFACERLGIEPDLLVTAKSLGGGMPLAAVTGRAEVMDAPGLGGIGGTFGGNPVSLAAASAVFETMAEEKLAARAEELGERFRMRAGYWKSRWREIGDVRGLGAMQAIELVENPETRAPAKALAEEVTRRCQERGLLLLTAGTFGNVIRLLVPLNIPRPQFEEGLEVLEGALTAVCEKRAAVSPRG
ncbi:MAG TPA: 4-aminobutyrate--2-oxoglutarate transaminase [Candidatus Acidoferrales bacterium]|nr:4-aminobutyrate--2-oxoglutarate transaminase [Candidatus Acidoferrales bacterium]